MRPDVVCDDSKIARFTCLIDISEPYYVNIDKLSIESAIMINGILETSLIAELQ
ncbi:MAG: hypothetical protein FWD38_02425 [Oscillospiraceae bacterium]|nr:hypothetical protein [Oscillospiraceae bacterium]